MYVPADTSGDGLLQELRCPSTDGQADSRLHARRRLVVVCRHVSVGVGQLCGVASLDGRLRHRGGEDDAGGLLVPSSAALTPCREINRGYLTTILVGELERDGLLVLGELSIHPLQSLHALPR